MTDPRPPNDSPPRKRPPSPTRRRFLGLTSTAIFGTLGGCSALYPAASRPVSADDWPLVGYDSAGAAYKPDGLSLRAKPAVRWKRKLPNVTGRSPTPLIYDGTVYSTAGSFLTVDATDGTTQTHRRQPFGVTPAIATETSYRNETVVSNDGRRVCGVNPGTGPRGDLRYRWRTPNPKSSFIQSLLPSGDAVSPVIADGHVFVPHDTGVESSVRALDPSDGRERWRYRSDGLSSRVSVYDGVVYIATWVNEFTALDAETGDVRWRRQPFKEVLTWGYVTAADHGVYGTRDDYAIAFDRKTGKRRWLRHLTGDGKYARIQGTPTVTDETVYVQITRDDEDHLLALDPRSGTTRWEKSVGEYKRTPVVAGDTVYVPDSRALLALDAKTGDERWKSETEKAPSPPAVGAGMVVFTDGFELYALEASR
ncbi:PQQ-binding-like beta-propeller repeat protein [Haladaptatus sp. AB643]|uniref:PQQ-binding-like beta-propeller repeat protein n=1 Tax=unclassified Haladaptatus TaxID=2622732 RepID=UPI00209BF716|nr:PQQ-like beta-propeller repeat protein [Haladaptatus sp. AB643]MCO8256314.1 PQQ-like beta-propeller repeat protein [Haladaptatus sp. AB618]